MKEPLVAGVSTPLVAMSVFAPLRSMVRLSKLAMPAASVVCEVVPLKMPVPLLMAIATDTPGTLLLKLSVTWTVTVGEITTPAVALLGGCTNAN